MPEPTAKQQGLLATLKKQYTRGTAALAVINLLSNRLPHFLYFNEYYILPGRVWFSCWTFLAKSGTRDSENSAR